MNLPRFNKSHVFVLSALLTCCALALPARPAGAASYETLRAVRAALTGPADAHLIIDQGTINVTFAPGDTGLDRAATLAWIVTNAQAVSEYFGRFPVDSVNILVVAEDGGKIGHGTTWGYGSSTIRVMVGRDSTAAVFANDWIMAHEMIHLALPNLPEPQLWALEGSATFAEPVARVQAGDVSRDYVWRGLLHGLPNGLPKPSDQGLDVTHSWGNIYWGGALFYLLAEIDIRQQTGNRDGVQTAFRAINAASKGHEAEWSMEEMVAVGDAATGTKVLANLYAHMQGKHDSTDLPALFAKLGVAEVGGKIVYDDTAPLAKLRDAMTAPYRP